MVKDTYDVTGGYLTRAAAGTDEKGQPAVHFNFNSQGGELFGELTGSHLPDTASGFHYKLGIILDNELYSAPSIQSRIYDSGQISGSFTPKAVKDLVDVLNAGSLPAALTKEPISKLYTEATLGTDTIEKSTHAMLIAVILVPLFMLWYYRFAGIVANIVLVLNMLMLVAIMLTIKAAFTLTGFAGLALTVGMAVDNNVLVFERLREEMDRGATLRMAIRNAFQRAGTTIIDCNLTHLIAATRALHGRLRPAPRLRRHPLVGRGHQHVHLGLRRPRDLRNRRKAAVDHQAQDDARDRAHRASTSWAGSRCAPRCRW